MADPARSSGPLHLPPVRGQSATPLWGVYSDLSNTGFWSRFPSAITLSSGIDFDLSFSSYSLAGCQTHVVKPPRYLDRSRLLTGATATHASLDDRISRLSRRHRRPTPGAGRRMGSWSPFCLPSGRWPLPCQGFLGQRPPYRTAIRSTVAPQPDCCRDVEWEMRRDVPPPADASLRV